MGLAASQARLLTITARKADCEFQSMALSHQKIALSRDMERISDEYQAAMNKTKLVYDFYGTGTSQMTLSYGLLMTPSVYNDYFPKFLTDKENRCVLSPEYAAAAKAAGIPHEGYNGTPSSEIRNLFIEALCNNGIITPATAISIESIPYNNEVGLGSLYSSQQATMDITYKDLLDLITANCVDSMDYGVPLGITARSNTDCNVVSWVDYPTELGDGWNQNIKLMGRDSSGNWTDLTGGFGGSHETNYAISLADLLEGDTDYVLYIESDNGVGTPVADLAYMQNVMVGDEYDNSFLNWLTAQFQTVLGGVKENDLALQYAYNQVLDLLYPTEDVQDKGKIVAQGIADIERDGGNGTDREDCYHRAFLDEVRTVSTNVGNGYDGDHAWYAWNEAPCYIGFTDVTPAKHKSHHNRSSVGVSLNNVADVFLTAFKEYLNGIDNSSYSYEKGQVVEPIDGKTPDVALYDPKDSDIFTILAPTNVSDGSEDLIASFYDSMFNVICTNGWTENENIENSEYMQEMLKTGAVYLSSIDNDAFYYQSSYSTDTYIQEVQDTDAIAQAEAKYNAQKARIENKENTIDMKMKNLDTEISSLTTEYDTMKNVISKSIEKSFKRYDA